MAIYGTRSANNVVDYASGNMYLAVNTGDSASASSYSWQHVGWTQGTKIANETEQFVEKDDSGQNVVDKSTVVSVMIEGTFLERTEEVRNHSLSGGIVYYTLVILGATVGSKREVWVFPKVTFDQAFDYEIGGKARMGYKLKAFAPDTAVTVTLPTNTLAGWDVSATTKTIPADQFYVTSDETKA